MRAVHENIEGPFSIEEDLAVYGLITAGATLRAGVRLVLHGTIAGDLTVEADARATIHGTVAGRILNHGGKVEVFGLAQGVEDMSPQARSIIGPSGTCRHVRTAGQRR